MTYEVDQNTILNTGRAVFVGSNFIGYALDKYPKVYIINLDELTYASKKIMPDFNQKLGHTFVEEIEGRQGLKIS